MQRGGRVVRYLVGVAFWVGLGILTSGCAGTPHSSNLASLAQTDADRTLLQSVIPGAPHLDSLAAVLPAYSEPAPLTVMAQADPDVREATLWTDAVVLAQADPASATNPDAPATEPIPAPPSPDTAPTSISDVDPVSQPASVAETLPATSQDAPAVDPTPEPSSATPPTPSPAAVPESSASIADVPAAASEPSTQAQDSQGEEVDPFAAQDQEEIEEYDPWERYNVAMFEFNRKLDRFVLKPVAKVYDKVLPDAVQKGVKNFLHNVRFVPRLLNNLLQLKVKGAGIEMSRFLINSTVGVGGFFDPAKHWLGLETPDEDLGQTLGFYGVKPGPYLILPLMPPLTLRDAAGFAGDIFLDPINYFVFPSIELKGAPSLIAHKNRGTTTIGQYGTRVEEIINERALNLEFYQGVEEGTVDLYGAVRNAHLQRRAKMIKE